MRSTGAELDGTQEASEKPQNLGKSRRNAAKQRELRRGKVAECGALEESCRSEMIFSCEGEGSGRVSIYRREKPRDFHFYP